MKTCKIGVGFHCGEPALANGIGHYLSALAAGGHVVSTKATDGTAGLYDLQTLARSIQGEYYGLWRKSIFKNSDGSSRDDVPNYGDTPQRQAAFFYEQIKAAYPADFDKELIWIENLNEADKNRAGWLGLYCKAFAELALADGFKVALGGWSGGEPEPEDWETAGMLAFLRLASEHPERIAVSLHEYTFGQGSMAQTRTHLHGRVTWLNAVCAKHGIVPPTVFLTEWGWSNNWAPVKNTAVPEMIEQLDWLHRHAPNVRGVHIWALDKGAMWGNIAQTVNGYMSDLVQAIDDHDWQDALPPEPPRPKVVIFKAAQEHSWNEYQAINGQAFKEYRRTVTFSHDDMLTMLRAGNAESYAVVFDPQLASQRAAIDALEQAGLPYQLRYLTQPEPPEPPPPPPVTRFDLLAYMRGDGRMYEVRHASGSTETFQTQVSDGTTWYQVKNSQYEALSADSEYIWRGIDTSPGTAPVNAERPGQPRYYRQWEIGQEMARWCKRYMAVGETWTGPGHLVQFYYKDNCAPSAMNSGNATNQVTLAAVHKTKTWNGITLSDVAELHTNTGEAMFFARGYGLVAWSSRWGTSAISEIHQGRPDLVRERGCFTAGRLAQGALGVDISHHQARRE